MDFIPINFIFTFGYFDLCFMVFYVKIGLFSKNRQISQANQSSLGNPSNAINGTLPLPWIEHIKMPQNYKIKKKLLSARQDQFEKPANSWTNEASHLYGLEKARGF